MGLELTLFVGFLGLLAVIGLMKSKPGTREHKLVYRSDQIHTTVDDLGSHCRLPSNATFAVKFFRQSHNAHQDDQVCEGLQAALQVAKTTFRRAGVHELAIMDNTDREFSFQRSTPDYTGRQAGKKLRWIEIHWLKDNSMAVIPQVTAVPPIDGTFVVRFRSQHVEGDHVVATLRVEHGDHLGNALRFVLRGRKVETAIRDRSGDWIEYLEYESQAQAVRLQKCIREGVKEAFMVEVKGGVVTKLINVGADERAHDKFMATISSAWALSSGDPELNLAACRTFMAWNDWLPRDFGTTPGEQELRAWLDRASSPEDQEHHLPTHVWLCQQFDDLVARCEQPGLDPWPYQLTNNGFHSAPIRPHSGS
ncbi:MAG: hypothetical protein O9327_03155 [Polaromonas sp.]|nr:hypothetical protein [Polaromonas sp.]